MGRTVARSRITTSRRKALFTWCCASAVAASELPELSMRRLFPMNTSGRNQRMTLGREYAQKDYSRLVQPGFQFWAPAASARVWAIRAELLGAARKGAH